MPAQPIDRDVLRGLGFILPDSPVSSVSEEFRIIKRQLLLGATGRHGEKLSRSERILVCSAHPGEGKTFCAINLALRSEEHTSELKSLMRISYAVFCLKTKKK